MPRVPLKKISSQTFEHEADRAALDALKKTIGFERLVRALARMGLDKEVGIMNKSSHVQCGPKQVPSLWKLYTEVCETLDVQPPPDLYLANNAQMNAFTIGVEKPVIVVTSALVEAMTDAEVQYVLGHELGHVLSGHVLYRIIAENIKAIFLAFSELTLGLGALFEFGIVSALLYWYRCSELTADRAGLLAVQEPRVVLSAIMKLAGGSSGRFASELDLDEFMKQAQDVKPDEDRWTRILRAGFESRTHPWTVVRAHEIDAWVKSGAHEKILAGEFIRRANGAIASGPHPGAGADGETGAAAAAELAIGGALARAFGVHVAPRIPEQALHLALGAFAEPLVRDERVVALYDDTFSGTGDKGVLLTDRRVFSHTRPKKGVTYASRPVVEDLAGGLLSRPGLQIGELELRFHTRDVRDAFRNAIRSAVEVHERT